MFSAWSPGVALPSPRGAAPRRLRAAARALLAAVLLAIAPGACNDAANGSLTLVIDTTSPVLDPLDPNADPRVARLVLYDDASGDSLGDAALELGGRTRLTALAPGTRDLRLEALSTTNQVLASARAFDVPLTLGHTDEVTLHLRKPLAYVGGGDTVEVFNTTGSSDTTDDIGSLPLAGVTAMATTRAGDLLLAAAGEGDNATFVWMSTADHSEMGRVPLGATIHNIVMHPRDQVAVLLQTDNQSMLVIDLEALRTGTGVESAFRQVDVPSPLAATFDTDDTLWLISSAIPNCNSSRPMSPGQLLHVDLQGLSVSASTALPSLANDVAMDPVNRTPVVAFVCAGLVGRLINGSFDEVARVNGVANVAIDGTTLYAVGWGEAAAGNPLPGVIAVRDLREGGAISTVQFPIEPRPITLKQTDGHGNYLYLYAPAMSLQARAAWVTPHGTRVAFLHTITYEVITDSHDPTTGQLLCTDLDISLQEDGVSLVDLETAQIVRRTATNYSNHCVCDHVDKGQCIEGLGQDLTGPAFIPTALNVLTGGK